MENDFDIDKIKEKRERKNAELKNIIQGAKESGVHESIINMLQAYDDFKCDDKIPIILYKGATEEEIVEFEKEFNVKIPAAYREFLKFSNGAELFEAGCIDLLGVDKNSMYSLYASNNDENRHCYDLDEIFPDNYLIIGVDGCGCPICADLNNGEIIFWDLEMCESDCIGDDFFDYLEDGVIGFFEWDMKNKE